MMSEETSPPAKEISGKAAALEVDGVPVARGLVSFYPNPDRGKFWPEGLVRLEALPAEGTFALTGSSMRVRIHDLRRSEEDPGHWNFMIAGRRRLR